MMRWFLFISLFLNGVSLLMYFKEKQKTPLEKVIIETHNINTPSKVTTKNPAAPLDPCPPKSSEKVEKDDFHEDFMLAEERNEVVKRDFLLTELNFSEEELVTLERLRNKHKAAVDKLFEQSHAPSGTEEYFKFQRTLLKLHEKSLRELKSHFGQERWKRYDKFRQEYNQKASENAPFVFMDP